MEDRSEARVARPMPVPTQPRSGLVPPFQGVSSIGNEHMNERQVPGAADKSLNG